MEFLQSLYADTLFRLISLTWLAGLDLLLLTIFFYFLLSLVRRSQGASLLRGILILGVILLFIILLLPLPAFDWLMIGVFIMMLIGTPIIFQPELRRLLERVGRSAGISWVVRQTAAETVLLELVRAAEQMSTSHTGALIALEGQDSLQRVIETGILIDGRVTRELLQAIFYSENPLHDGAAILREDRIIAASCVLPLTERPLFYERRLGTRHRAAVGLSENSDALVIVVSEETGQISVARHGRLRRPLDGTGLREQIFKFYTPTLVNPSTLSIRSLMRRLKQKLWQRPSLPTARHLLSNIGLLLLSILLAIQTWSFIIGQTDPPQRTRVSNIPLRVENLSPGMTIVKPLPSAASAIIQTTASVQPTLGADSFQAVVSLQGLSPGLHRVPIQVISGDSSQIRVLEVNPPALDLELASIITRTMGVAINLLDEQNLPPAYRLTDTPQALPDQVLVVGAAPLVEQVSQVQATISLANADTSLREVRPLRALDEKGREVTGVSLQPDRVQINVSIQRQLNAREVAVRAVITGSTPPGYWLSGVTISPTIATLQGQPDQLAEVGSFINTFPVDVSQAIGDLEVSVPLDLPPNVRALDSNGNTIRSATVVARIAARRANLALTRSIELIGVTSDLKIMAAPSRLELLLEGPLAVLNQIEANPNLVRVQLDLVGLVPSQNTVLTPTVIVPSGIEVEAIPNTVRVEQLPP